MSKWTYIPKEDLDLDGDEINILVGSDYEGNNYAIVKVSDIKELLK